eukprot:TRINITY_DN6432_c0_g1_i1.p1 TRINITY_DN6432_c0_g1~~TRINITY_DN6432_c0_g1_i1.p1  ORF type:complete len:162 (-),score=11.62 TRINITY_DN6432_c0_g1_i1:277-762(-)
MPFTGMQFSLLRVDAYKDTVPCACVHLLQSIVQSLPRKIAEQIPFLFHSTHGAARTRGRVTPLMDCFPTQVWSSHFAMDLMFGRVFKIGGCRRLVMRWSNITVLSFRTRMEKVRKRGRPSSARLSATLINPCCKVRSLLRSDRGRVVDNRTVDVVRGHSQH